MAAAFHPLFAPYMVARLGFGPGVTVLAAAVKVLGAATITTLWFYGETLRARSPYCAANTTV